MTTAIAADNSTQDDAIALNTSKRTDTQNDNRYFQQSEVNTKLADYSLTTAIAADNSTQNTAIDLNTAKRTDVQNDARYHTQTHINTQLGSKQDNIENDHLDIAHTSGLQTALDAKAPTLNTSVLYHSTASGGRVGVGTAVPAKVFHVHADSAPSGDLMRFSSNGGFNVQYIVNSGGEKNFQMSHTGDEFHFYHLGTKVAQFDADGLHASNGLILSGGAPANSGADGVIGQIRVDANYIYVCTANNTWKRIPSVLQTYS